MISSISGMGTSMAAMQAARPRPDPEGLFSKIDADGNGSVDATELQTMADDMAEKMGDQAPSVEDLMIQMDSDSNGVMSFAEFEAGRPKGPPPGPPPAAAGGMDLDDLFSGDEDEDISLYESLYA